jgi:hypothetical protein
MVKLFTLSFEQWITQFRDEKSDRGIFARWFDDRCRNSYSKWSNGKRLTKVPFLRSLEKGHCSEFVKDTFLILWKEFEQVPNAVTTHNNKGIKIKITRM